MDTPGSKFTLPSAASEVLGVDPSTAKSTWSLPQQIMAYTLCTKIKKSPASAAITVGVGLAVGSWEACLDFEQPHRPASNRMKAIVGGRTRAPSHERSPKLSICAGMVLLFR